jgi:hypothetical protein
MFFVLRRSGEHRDSSKGGGWVYNQWRPEGRKGNPQRAVRGGFDGPKEVSLAPYRGIGAFL